MDKSATPLTPEAEERAAEALALACNGGDWRADYTDEHRTLWRHRVASALSDEGER